LNQTPAKTADFCATLRKTAITTTGKQNDGLIVV